MLKLFVNDTGAGEVENVKLMWNDWSKNVGYGIHVDSGSANTWATAVATRYAPEQADDILAAFQGSSDVVITNSDFTIKYSYFHGPAIDERLLTITEK